MNHCEDHVTGFLFGMSTDVLAFKIRFFLNKWLQVLNQSENILETDIPTQILLTTLTFITLQKYQSVVGG